jgi:hypothetical protein
MALNLVSPGVSIREIDLTTGRVDNGSSQIAGIAGPFSKGPVSEPVLITSENELLNTFGKPVTFDSQNEYWLTASSYLSYGGSLRVVRADNSGLNNAFAAVGAATTLKIKNAEDYQDNYSSGTGWYFAAKNPGSWANSLKVCTIDHFADQIIGLSTSNPTNSGAIVGNGVTVSLSNITIAGVGATSSFNGFLKGVITKVNTSNSSTNTSTIEVKILSRVSNTTITQQTTLATNAELTATPGETIIYLASVVGINTVDTFNVSGIATNISIVSVGATSVTLASGIGATITAGTNVTITRNVTSGGVETPIAYVEGYRPNSILQSDTLTFLNTSGNNTGSRLPVVSTKDWYNEQTLGLTNSTIYWRSLAPKPGTSEYASERNSKNDEIHVVVVDETGAITGVAANVIEKFASLTKSSDGRISPSQSFYYKDVIANRSRYIYVGVAETGSKSTISQVNVPWGTKTQDKSFDVLGAKVYELTNGKDYNGVVNNYGATTANIITAYNEFNNVEEYQLDFIINGPSGGDSIYESQSKASSILAIASTRKDCVACISPHKDGIVGEKDTEVQTTNVIEFFSPLQSTSYGLFDSGYKYMYDRFNDKFEWVNCSGDIAGLMARTFFDVYPWFSPAGASRGSLNNAARLAYNPNKSQRDRLYANRVNPIIASPGAGIILFGDKTAFAQASAFDRINVRRLFLTIEKAIEGAARAQLFEFNDLITRTNFVNIVEPYLRDVKAKRGVTDFLVVCDESNNTPDVIDSNQFRADIYIKPARSINFIGLTFVATRTGVSFEEIVGSV